MKGFLKIITLVLLVTIIISCQKKLLCPDCDVNKPPIANAGVDQTILFPADSVMLDGSQSFDSDGTIINYNWTKISGLASANIIHADSSKTLVKMLATGIYQFELRVTDNGAIAVRDTVQVIVYDPKINQAPVANAGADQTITLPTNSINLDGGNSNDPDNNITNYAWTKLSGPASINFSNPSNVHTLLTNLEQGAYHIELTVTDAGGLFSKDTVQVNVNPAMSIACVVDRPLINAQLIPVGSLSIPRSAISVASAGNKILFAGGADGNNYNSVGGVAFKRVDIFDIITQNWSTAELSMERFNMGVAVAGNRIFFAGGQDGNDTWLAEHYKRIDVYDVSTDKWTIDSLSRRRVSPAGEVIDNKVFFAGGWDWYYGMTGDALIVDILNLSTGSWSVASLSETKAHLSSEVMGNKIYFAGGAHGYYYPTVSGRIDVFDNNAGYWSVENMLEPKAYFASIGYAGKIYWAGGISGNAKASSLVEIKDVATNSSTQACLFQPNSHFSAVLKNNKIVFFTGVGAVKNKFDIFDPATNVWSIGVLPFDISEASVISVNNTIYVAGGLVNGVLSSKVWRLEF